jgi:hypothetical protein
MLALADIVIQFAFWSAVAFMVGYTLLANWWKSQVGWARISLDFGIALALSPSAIHWLFGARIDNSPGFAWYTIGAIALVGLVSLWNLALVAGIQFKRRRRDGGYATDRDVRPS